MDRLRCFICIVTAGCAIGAISPGFAQGRWLDVGSGVTERVTMGGDLQTFEELPPYAFGDYPRGTAPLYVELLPLGCDQLPNREPCEDDTFVAGVQSFLDTGNCPCTGTLLREVLVQIRYDPARVRDLGGRASDLRIVLYDPSGDLWRHMPGATVVDETEHVVRASQAFHIAQIYAVVLTAPADAASWGAIKAHWQR